jgi:hypothetical protein
MPDLGPVEYLNRAVVIFNAISLCDFPHSEGSYRDLLRCYLEVAGAEVKTDDQTASEVRVRKRLLRAKFAPKKEKDMNDVIEIEAARNNVVGSGGEKRPPVDMSEEERAECFEHAVDLFERMNAGVSSAEDFLVTSLIRTIVKTRSPELLRRFISSQSPSFIVRSIGDKFNDVLKAYSHLKNHRKLMEFCFEFSASPPRKMVKNGFSSTTNWKYLIDAFVELRKEEKEELSEKKEHSEIENSSNSDEKNNFPVEEKLILRNGEEETIENLTDPIFTEIDQIFNAITSNCSRNRVFVDNDELVNDVANMLMEEHLPLHAITVLRTALDDKTFSAPERFYKKSELWGGTRSDSNDGKEIRDFRRRIVEIERSIGPKLWIKKVT